MSPHDETNIRAEVRRRGITRVVHFTQSRKLAQILGYRMGVWSSSHLGTAAGDVFDANDQSRYDNHEDHISCSVEYPNGWMLRTAREREAFFPDWAILFIAPDVLWRPGTLFSPRNAAAEGGRLLTPGFAGFEALFQPAVVGARGMTFRRESSMLACAPTDDQGEVMVERHIPLADIRGVAVRSTEQARLEIARLRAVGPLPDVQWVVAPDLFTNRTSSFVRGGVRPPETLYSDEDAVEQ